MEQNEEISLLDLLVIIAENWLWLFLVPLAAGAITFAVLQTQPQHYQASADVALPSEEIIRFITDDDLAPIPQIALVPASGLPGLFVMPEDERASTLTVTLPSPNEAQTTLQAVLAALEQGVEAGQIGHPASEPGEQIATLEAMIALRERIVARLEQSLDELGRATPFEPESYALTATALTQILDGRNQDMEMLADLHAELAANQPVAGEVTVTGTGRSPVLISLLAILASGFAMLILIFVAHGLKSASRDPGARPKLDRIKNALLLRKRPKGNDS